MPQPSEAFLRKRSAQILEGKSADVAIFNPDAEEAMPKFGPKEIDFGKYLGKGGFCTVVELKNVRYVPQTDKKVSSNQHDLSQFVTVQDKDFIATNFIRDGQARYALKKLTKGLYQVGDAQHFVSGVIDLASEVKYLCALKHPHIIKIRAMADTTYCDANFFILMDKLYGTMTDRVEVWKKKSKKMFMKKEQRNELLSDRMMIAHDLSSGLGFLHDNNIIYRDLKPENIGFDVRGDVKIFDFGLAKEVKEIETRGLNDTFNLTGNTGSPRYMAPEVALSLPYNEKSDVYSFALLMSLIFDLKVPFEGFNHSKMSQKVWKGNVRPKVGAKWPLGIKALVPRCWDKNINKRPSFEETKDILYAEAQGLCGEDAYLLDLTNRSTRSAEERMKKGRKS